MEQEFLKVYNINSIDFKPIDSEVYKQIRLSGSNAITNNYNKAEQVGETFLTGYLNDEEPFIVCGTSKGNSYLITNDYSVQLQGTRVGTFIDNNGKFYINDIVLYKEKDNASTLEVMTTGNLSTNCDSKPSSALVETLYLERLSFVHQALNDNKTNTEFTKVQKIFSEENLFYIEVAKQDGNRLNSIKLQLAYENEESYKNGDLPIAIAGDIRMNNINTRIVSLVRNDNGKYETIKFEDSRYSAYIENYEEYKDLMNKLGFGEIPISDAFRNLTNKGLQKPNVIKAINHYLRFNQLCAADSVILESYSANINGIELSSNNKEYERQL